MEIIIALLGLGALYIVIYTAVREAINHLKLCKLMEQQAKQQGWIEEQQDEKKKE